MLGNKAFPELPDRLEIQKPPFELLSKITNEIEIVNEETGEKTCTEIEEKLANHPEIQKEWNAYEKCWNEFTEKHSEWKTVHDVYSKLYSIYQQRRKSMEECELILGIGLYLNKDGEGNPVRRHLIVADAELELDAKEGRLIVKERSDGCNLRAELEVFDDGELPLKAENEVKALLEQIEDNLWDRDNIEKILNVVLNSAFQNGEYKMQLEPIRNVGKPTIMFAPAIILRSKSSTDRIKVLEDIDELIARRGGET